MASKRKSQSAPKPDVRVRISLFNNGKSKRNVLLPSSYKLFADIVAAASQSGTVETRESLTKEQVDQLVNKLYRERDAASRIKNETAQAGINELIHAVNGMRLYKLRAVGGAKRWGTADNVRIVCEAWVRS